jgi:hypothetical protein
MRHCRQRPASSKSVATFSVSARLNPAARNGACTLAAWPPQPPRNDQRRTGSPYFARIASFSAIGSGVARRTTRGLSPRKAAKLKTPGNLAGVQDEIVTCESCRWFFALVCV